MGCSNSTDKESGSGGEKYAAGNTSDAKSSRKSLKDLRNNKLHHVVHICPFCRKKVEANELQNHSLRCPEREVECGHVWCREIVRQKDRDTHMELCRLNRRVLCAKCGVEVLEVQMSTHRDACHPSKCERCGEKCIARIHQWCPTAPQNRRVLRGPFAVDMLKEKYSNKVDYNITRIKLLWRFLRLKDIIEETIFRTVFKEMDHKKEGFAIFRASNNEANKKLRDKTKSSSIGFPQAPATIGNYEREAIPASRKVKITMSHVNLLLGDLGNQKLPSLQSCQRIFSEALELLQKLDNVVRFTPMAGVHPDSRDHCEGCHVVVVGDLHGQLSDLRQILKDLGNPAPDNCYIFNGDFVDRGNYSVEVLLVLFSLYLAFPKCVFLNRGNHECRYMNEEYGFNLDVSSKYNHDLYKLILKCFNALPLATIIRDKIFVVHGGLPRNKDCTIAQINKINRFREIPIPSYSSTAEDDIFTDLLWSDPVSDIANCRKSDRGVGVEFGEEITKGFLETNQLELVVRSHEDCESGYMEHHSKKLYTVFSCSNYTGPNTNTGAVCIFMYDDMTPEFRTYRTEETEACEEYELTNESFSGQHMLSVGLEGSFAYRNGKDFGLPSSLTSTPLRRPIKTTVLRELRELVYQCRHWLLTYFSKIDRTKKGSVWIMEWAGAMKNVLHLNLPWYFLRPFLVPIYENRIHYGRFIRGIQNAFQALWINDWEQEVCEKIVKKSALPPPNKLWESLDVREITYHSFCHTFRELDKTISDAVLFQLFQLIDKKGDGVFSGAIVEKTIKDTANAAPGPLKWDVDAIDQFHRCVIQGRVQLQRIFSINDTFAGLDRGVFEKGMAMIGEGMQTKFSAAQIEKIYQYLIQLSSSGEILFETFLLIMNFFHEDVDPYAFVGNAKNVLICKSQ